MESRQKNSAREDNHNRPKTSRIPSKLNLATRSEVTKPTTTNTSPSTRPTTSSSIKRPLPITQSDLTSTGFASNLKIPNQIHIGGGGGAAGENVVRHYRFGLLRQRSKSDLGEKHTKSSAAAIRPDKMEKSPPIADSNKLPVADRHTQVRRNAEKRTTEQQLSVKKKIFFSEKQKLREAQTQLMDLYRSLQAVQEKMNAFTGRDDRAADELRLVAYVPPLLQPAAAADDDDDEKPAATRTMLDETILQQLHEDLQVVYKNGLRLCHEFFELNRKLLGEMKAVRLMSDGFFVIFS